MSDTILRHIEMLTLIPAQPAKVTARGLHAKLQQSGFAVDVRSIERDLHKLSEKFPLDADAAGQPDGAGAIAPKRSGSHAWMARPR